MRTDFENIQDDDAVILYPRGNNPIHRAPVKAIFAGGYFYCDGTNPADGPDYYFGDVLSFCEGFDASH